MRRELEGEPPEGLRALGVPDAERAIDLFDRLPA